MTRNTADAEDLVQETFAKAYASFEQFEPARVQAGRDAAQAAYPTTIGPLMTPALKAQPDVPRAGARGRHGPHTRTPGRGLDTVAGGLSDSD